MMYVLLAVLGVIMFAISVWVMVAGARRVLGVRLGTPRTIVASLLSWSAASLVGRSLPEPGPGHEATILLFIIPFFGGTLVCATAILFVLEQIRPTGSGLGVLSGWRALRGRLARARRYSRITSIAVRHGLGGYLAGRRARTAGVPQRRSLARALRMALEDGGVTFVKLGQVLSTRPDLLPPEFIEELSRLQDRVAPVPIEQIRQVIAEELGAPADEVFDSFDPVPLASASIAQVHRARLRSGADAVVKVQRPDVRPTVERDLDIVRRLAASLESRTSWAQRAGPGHAGRRVRRRRPRGARLPHRGPQSRRGDGRLRRAAGAVAAAARGAVHRAGPGDGPAGRGAAGRGGRRDRGPRAGPLRPGPRVAAFPAAPGDGARGVPRRPASGQRAAAHRRPARDARLRLGRPAGRRPAQRLAEPATGDRPGRGTGCSRWSNARTRSTSSGWSERSARSRRGIWPMAQRRTCRCSPTCSA